MKPKALWIEDSARLELANLCGPVFFHGRCDLSLAEDATTAANLLLAEPYQAVIVDIRLPPGTDARWRDHYSRTGSDKVSAQLGNNRIKDSDAWNLELAAAVFEDVPGFIVDDGIENESRVFLDPANDFLDLVFRPDHGPEVFGGFDGVELRQTSTGDQANGFAGRIRNKMKMKGFYVGFVHLRSGDRLWVSRLFRPDREFIRINPESLHQGKHLCKTLYIQGKIAISRLILRTYSFYPRFGWCLAG